MVLTEQSFGSYQQQPNAGQVARLKLLPIEAVLALSPPGEWPAPAPGIISRFGLAVAGGSVATELIFPIGGGSFQESSETSGAGTAWSLELMATIPKNQAGLLDWIHRNKARRWLALWLDRNGLAYLAGEWGNGLRMEASRAVGSINSQTLTFRGRATHPAWFLETFDSTQLFADVDFDLAFDLSFNA
ncbi:hypothetical protein GO755_39340 [Spirosoma sp. HMF4905]|uniref:Uncharacterized protein n=1 Tax=Spirosoma arboris TaxID=2682092 RepID=A0A7K1SR03_9BACT|nr:hypothetical protein [Spirosoma arboris]MVM36133.1 hypothetical protein [Spirosoma arboris]